MSSFVQTIRSLPQERTVNGEKFKTSIRLSHLKRGDVPQCCIILITHDEVGFSRFDEKNFENVGKEISLSFICLLFLLLDNIQEFRKETDVCSGTLKECIGYVNGLDFSEEEFRIFLNSKESIFHGIKVSEGNKNRIVNFLNSLDY